MTKFTTMLSAPTKAVNPARGAGRAFAVVAGAIVFAALSLFLIKDHYSVFGRTRTSNVFACLAWSFLQGRLDLNNFYFPKSFDISVFHGNCYAYWPPLCAFLLMPAVKLRGLYFGDKWFSILFVAVSAFAGWLIMDCLAKRQGWQISPWYKTLLTIFLGFGTSNLVLSVMGTHYYMAQVAGSMMMMLAILSAFALNRKSWQLVIAGSFWSLAVLSRMHLILALPLFLYVALFGTSSSPDWRDTLKNWKARIPSLVALLLPLMLVLAFFAWYNWARFGSPFENGITFHNMCPKFLRDFHQYGYISTHYFFYNCYYTLLRLPLFENQALFKEPPPGANDWMEGYSLFFQSPALLYIFASLPWIRKDYLVCMLWLAVFLVSIPILCLMGTGWTQFGARYLFDLFALMFPLTILGSRGKITPIVVLLIAASVGVNLWGLHLFGEV